MRERPILFSAPMVRALLDGTKTQTRRVVKPQFAADALPVEMPATDPAGGWVVPGHSGVWWCDVAANPDDLRRCPYGQPGDRLWVRETWQFHGGMLDGGTGRASDGGFLYTDMMVSYPADGARVTLHPNGQDWPTPKQPPQRQGEVYSLRDAPEDFKYDGENTYCDRLTRWWNRQIPAIHMYRWASRIDLEITGVRVERLQDVSEEDADAEGCERLDSEREVHDWTLCPRCGGTRLHNALGPNLGVIFDVDCQHCDTYVKRYRHLWEAINGAGSWAANPWVWVVEFRRVRP